MNLTFYFVVVTQSRSHVPLFATLWTVACKAPFSSIISQFAQIHDHGVSDAISPFHPLPPPSPFAFRLFQHQGLFQWVDSESGDQGIKASSLASVLPMNIQGWFPLGLTGLMSCSPRSSQKSSPALQFKSIISLALSLLYGLTLKSVHDYWKNHSFDYTDVILHAGIITFPRCWIYMKYC